ncbi:hypothetical protein NC653_018906 [Populus alba x Populus x berolinensis]|uniref:Uncharacterized protein n=1 Tax=Populus alba x Populus x berolinensis TaxID=444605 RepID=A0AAD6QHI6_9ROSI|nr:hypothetical protein NC653_018906 [Populus alba x Populus x berolinensis]
MSPSRTLDLRCSSSGGIFPNMASSSRIPLGADPKGLGPSSDHLLVESCSEDHVPEPSPAASGLGPSAEIAIMDHQHLQDSGMPQSEPLHPAMAENRDVNQGRRHYMTRSRARNLAADTAIISTSTGSRFKPVVVVRLWKGLWTRILPLPHYDPLVWLLDVIIGCFLYRLNILLLMFGFYCYNLYMIVSSFE